MTSETELTPEDLMASCTLGNDDGGRLPPWREFANVPLQQHWSFSQFQGWRLLPQSMLSLEPSREPLLGNQQQEQDLLRCCKWCFCFSLLFVAILAGALTILWYGVLEPLPPLFTIDNVKVERIHIHIKRSELIIPRILLDINLTVSVNVSNPNTEGFKYKSTMIDLDYCGQEIGKATTGPGYVPGCQSQVVRGVVDLQGVDVGKMGPRLLEDWQRHEMLTSIDTTVCGEIFAFGFQTQIEAKVHCDMIVNPQTRTLLSNTCTADVEII